METNKELQIANLLKALELSDDTPFKATVLDYVIQTELKALQYDKLIDEKGGYKHNERNVFSRRSTEAGVRGCPNRATNGRPSEGSTPSLRLTLLYSLLLMVS